MPAFAETRVFDIAGEKVSVETFGNAKFYDGEVEEKPIPVSIQHFIFYMDHYRYTESINNKYSKWRVQTQACLRNHSTGVMKNDSNSKYIVAVKDSKHNTVCAYEGKADNIYGGLVFNNLPKAKLYIAVSRSSQGDWYLYGKGDTEFLR